MNGYKEKIEFYKNRTIGERFSAAADFLKQTWKVLLINLSIVGIPLAIILGYSMQHSRELTYSDFGNFSTLLTQNGWYYLATFVTYVILYAITGAIMIQYEKGELHSDTRWRDLSSTVFSIIGKTLKISLILFLFLALIAFLFGFIFSALNFLGILLFLLFLLILAAIFLLLPFFTILYYPAYFKGASSWQSIKIAFTLGLRNWGSIFVAIILCSILLFIVSAIFVVPYTLITLLPGKPGLISFIFAIVSSLGTIITTPVCFVIFAFQYFSITEKEEGVSLHSHIDEFDNL
jgi:hypothetical protein